MNADASLFKRLDETLQKKGFGTFASSHEVLGVITEEYHELVGAQKANDLQAIRHELYDIAVGCLFAIACIEQGELDW